MGHVPVLYQEVINGLQPRPGGRYIDGTVGAGGHAGGVLAASSPDGRVLGLDADPEALAVARERLAPYGERFVLAHADFRELGRVARRHGFDPVDGILLDLGLSSLQLDAPERGFAFQEEGPLDMRFDPSQPTTAADLVNRLPEAELADLIYRYGEEPASRRIARAIVARRPVQTTAELAEIVRRAVPGHYKRHPATRTFQALRIAVNEELESLSAVLPQAVELLKPGGRLAVITFHSLEDRLVKDFLRKEARGCHCPPETPTCVCGHVATLRILTRHPIQPGDAEVQRNPRSRSAKLRIAEKRESNYISPIYPTPPRRRRLRDSV